MNDEQAVNQEVAVVTKEAEKLSQTVYATKIKSEAALQGATEVLVNIKKLAKETEKRRKAITQPINQALKNINELFKAPADRLADAEKLIKDEIIAYQSRMAARAEKKADKIEAQVDAGETGLEDAMGKLGKIKQAPTSIASADAGGASIKVTKKIKIVDPGKLPAKYFLRERVLEALRMEVSEDVTKKGMPVPDGAEQYEDRQVAVRTQ